MRKIVVLGAITAIGISTVYTVLETIPMLGEKIVYADDNVVLAKEKTLDIWFNSMDQIYLNEAGLLKFYGSSTRILNSIDSIRVKKNGAITNLVDNNKLLEFDSPLVTGDQFEISIKEGVSDVYNMNRPDNNNRTDLVSGKTYVFTVKNDGIMSIEETHLINGQGQTQVTYNVNAMAPDDPTSNPEYTVVIPTEYKLSDTQKLAAGTIALKDAKDVSKDYAGDQAVKVSVTSAKSFKFDNGGEYKLVDGVKANIPTEITLNKTTTSSVVNAQLTKEGSKTASADMLTFSYTVAP